MYARIWRLYRSFSVVMAYPIVEMVRMRLMAVLLLAASSVLHFSFGVPMVDVSLLRLPVILWTIVVMARTRRIATCGRVRAPNSNATLGNVFLLVSAAIYYSTVKINQMKDQSVPRKAIVIPRQPFNAILVTVYLCMQSVIGIEIVRVFFMRMKTKLSVKHTLNPEDSP